MNEAEMSRFITDTYPGVDVVDANGDSFFFYNPDPNVPPDHRFPFVTLVRSNFNDQFSDLDRPSVFRVNIGISKPTFRSLFGEPTRPSGTDDGFGSGASGVYDFTALDQVMPHPVYGRMLWVCVLNPSDETFATNVRPLLDEAYQMAVTKHDRLAARNAALASGSDAAADEAY